MEISIYHKYEYILQAIREGHDKFIFREIMQT